MGTWGQRIERERRDGLVRREAEEARFSAFMVDPDHRLLALWGMPGCGKTTLLARFAALAGPAVQTLGATSRPLTREAWRDAFDPSARLVLLDDAHLLGDLLDYLVDSVFPTLGDHQRLVLAGLRPPPARLLQDPGWAPLVDARRLGPLTPSESDAFFARAGVPVAQRPGLAALGAGHPLALRLIAERWDGFDWAREHDARRALLDRMLAGVSPGERRVLEVAALNRQVSLELLAQVAPTAADAFHAVAEGPLVMRGPGGLSLAPVLREPLAQELSFTAPDLRDALLGSSLAHSEARGRAGPRTRRVFWAINSAELIGRALRSRSSTTSGSSAVGTTEGLATRGDVEPIVRHVEARLGERSARTARHWLERAPRGARVCRQGGALVAYVHFLDLDTLDGADVEADPLTEEFVALAARERVTCARLARFYLPLGDRDEGLPFVIRETTAELLFGVGLELACSAQPDAFLETYRELGAHPRVARFTVDGEPWSLSCEDLRRYAPGDLVRIWNQLCQADATLFGGGGGGASEGVFTTPEEAYPHLRRALRSFHDATRLGRLPLSRAPRVRAMLATGEASETAQALRASLMAAVHELGVHGEDGRARRVLEASYFGEPRKQFSIARELGVGESTYRRHLKSALERLAEVWVAAER